MLTKPRLHLGIIARFCAALTLAVLALSIVATAPSFAAGVRLIMVEQDGCRYCIDWDREIAPKYPKSAEGRFAPLQRAKRGDAALKGFNPVIYTPTFLVVRDGEEVGRVTGYAGKLFFYEQLDEELAKAGFQPNWGIPDFGSKTSAPDAVKPIGLRSAQIMGQRSLPHAAN